MADMRYETVPVPYMADGVRRYIENGVPPGGFLTAVICNDLRGACGRADENNRAALYDWVVWFCNEAPHNCWGSPEAMQQWMRSRRPDHTAA